MNHGVAEDDPVVFGDNWSPRGDPGDQFEWLVKDSGRASGVPTQFYPYNYLGEVTPRSSALVAEDFDSKGQSSGRA